MVSRYFAIPMQKKIEQIFRFSWWSSRNKKKSVFLSSASLFHSFILFFIVGVFFISFLYILHYPIGKCMCAVLAMYAVICKNSTDQIYFFLCFSSFFFAVFVDAIIVIVFFSFICSFNLYPVWKWFSENCKYASSDKYHFLTSSL